MATTTTDATATQGLNKIVMTTFTGGVSYSEKSGFEGSARRVEHLDIHDDRNHMVISRINLKVSGSVVTALPQWMVDASIYDGNHYVYDASGNIYKETSGGVWTNDHVVASGDGSGMYVLNNYLYYSSPYALGRKGPLSSNPMYNDNFLSDGTFNLDQTATTSGFTFTLPASIIESAITIKPFVPTKDPIKEIDVKLASAGAGNWTLTVHDSKNTPIGSATVANASLVGAGVMQPFIFSTPLSIVINNTYHFHLTSTDGTGTVTTGTAGDLSTVSFNEYFSPLMSSQFHPMENLNGLVIGNGRYLAFYDEVTYNPNRIVLPAGFNVRSIARENEFLVAAAWYGIDLNHITEVRYYYWDGISPSFNYWKPAPKLIPSAITTYKNRLVSLMGPKGHIFLGTEPFQTVYRFPRIAVDKQIQINPGAVSEWSGRLAIGAAAFTDDGSFIQGVYTYGNNTDSDPEVLTNDFSITGGRKTDTGVHIGMVKGIGKYLYYGWADPFGNYGVDQVATDGAPESDAIFESLIFDKGDPDKLCHALKIVITFTALKSGTTVTPKYKIDRSLTGFVFGNTFSTTNGTSVEQVINAPFHEIEFGFETHTFGNEITITGVKLYWNEIPDNR